MEAFKRHRGDVSTMSKATKIVLGTIGVSTALAVAIVFVIAFGAA